MAKVSKISYITIPDEIALIIPIDADIDDAIYDVMCNNDITCVALNGDVQKSQDAIDKMSAIIGDKKVKTAWLSNRENIPFKSEYFSYVRTAENLYANIGDKDHVRFLDITDRLETLDKINPLDPRYFDTFDELKQKPIKLL